MNYKKILYSCMLLFIFLFINQQSASAQQATIMYSNENGKKLAQAEASDIKQQLVEIDSFIGDFSQSAIKKLKASKDIAVVHTGGYTLKMSNATTNMSDLVAVKPAWNNKMINVQEAWKQGYTGKNIKIGIIDTPIAAIPGIKLSAEKFFISKTYPAKATAHGTFIASIINAQTTAKKSISGIAPAAKLYSISVINDRGADLNNVIAGINYAIKKKLAIINLSIGISKEDLLGANETITKNPLAIAIKKAQKAGILVVAASGNYGYGVDYPAAFKDVIAVGAVEANKTISYFSNMGPEVTVLAPGENIKSYSYTGKIIGGSGTSFATPHVVGMLAILKEQFPKDSNAQLTKRLKLMTLPIKAPNSTYAKNMGIIHYPQAGNFTSLEKMAKDKAYITKNKKEITIVISKMRAGKKVNYTKEYKPLQKVYNALSTSQKTTIKTYRKKYGY
ncbi:S8 family peptidase [Kurthia sibirica]|uniref:Peptidase S8/S53 domain-containing protein n=1 Tax=Kurthia sibirica TaxID=202750 RepID=A0A2U3AIF9_9BACL|nr:S8 family serine peptidase [Kurthia sibirica]PWI24342.1 hypothetical protein DEX24_14050 [Kurthia sibirica]GEK34371.1 hypothetical protein KSI01_19040 [Kurthia sibirica]